MSRLLILLVFFLPFYTMAQSDQPILTLNTEMHTSKISRVDTDALGRYVLTCSKDKTAKLWDAKTGKLLQIFRPPIGSGNNGMLYSAALSPNGTYVAVAGWSESRNHDIYIFHSQTGILENRISELPNVVFDLEFSPDGLFLVAGLGGSNGIRIYKTKNWELFNQDEDYDDQINNVAFDPAGKLTTLSYDGYVRLYDKGFNLIKKGKTTGGSKLLSLDFSSDGKKLVIGYDDSPRAQILDVNTLKVIYELKLGDANKMSQRLGIVKFSDNGKQLIAGGFLKKKQTDGIWWRMIRIWEEEGKGRYKDYPATANSITDIKLLENGHILYTSSNPDWGILDRNTGERIIYQGPETNDHSKSDRTHLRLNSDGMRICWKPYNKKPLSFDITSRILTEQASNDPPYRSKSEQLDVTEWKNSYAPKLNGEPISFLKDNEKCRTVDIANHEQIMVFGTDWSIQGLDLTGSRLWRTSLQSPAWAVNIANNSKVVAACQGDGTLRWYRMSDGELLLTLFVHPDKRWVLWTPSGYYDASAGAEDLIGWHVNQGKDTEGLYYPIAKFRDTYYRPDVIDRILLTVDEDKALRLANEAAGKKTSSTRTILEALPPTVRILSPTMGTSISQKTIDLTYSIKSPNNEKIIGVKILVDGRPVSNDRGVKPAGKRETKRINIPARNCTISVIAENRAGASPVASVDINWSGQLEFGEDMMKPNLYILAVGVADYQNDSFDLEYPDDDARAFVRVLKKQEGLLYGQVRTKLLVDRDATKDNILDGLDWLVKETTQHDVAMLFFAGHGIEDTRGKFYYLPVGADENVMRKTCLTKAAIQETVEDVSGKIIVFMDACHSGNLMLASNGRRNTRDNPDISRIVNELIAAENGAVVYSSSTGRQSSLEDSNWGHGAFTKALIEGLSGKAKHKDDAKVTCKSLDIYISKRVKQLTRGQQTPTTNYPPNVPDFPIAISQ